MCQELDALAMTRNGSAAAPAIPATTKPPPQTPKPDARPADSQVGSAAARETLFVMFLVGDLKCALPLVDVQEIAAMVAVTPLPGAHSDILGVIDCHGTPCPVVDIRSLLKSPARMLGPEQHLVIVRLHHRLLAVPCDQVERVLSAQVLLAPAGLEGGELIAGLVREEAGVVLVLDSTQLLPENRTPLRRSNQSQDAECRQ